MIQTKTMMQHAWRAVLTVLLCEIFSMAYGAGAGPQRAKEQRLSKELMAVYQASKKSAENYDSVLFYSEKLDGMAQKSGEAAGRVLAARMLLEYFRDHGTTENMEKAVGNMRDVCQEVGDMSSFQEAVAMLCEHYRRKHLTAAAFDMVLRTYNEAKKENDHYGIFQAYSNYGLLYADRRDYDKAKSYYQLALAEQPHIPQMSLAPTCISLSKLYDAESDSALIYLDKGMAVARSMQDTLLLYERYAELYARQMDKANTERYCAMWSDYCQAHSYDAGTERQARMDVYKNIANKQWGAAEKAAQALSDVLEKYSALAFIGRQSGNKMLENSAEVARLAYLDSIQTAANHVALEEVAAKSRLDEQKAVKHKEEMRTLWITAFIIMLLLVVGCIVATILFRKKNEELKKEEGRRKKDREEVENLKKSNATQKLFLQNMSHEIRTPLNAICGFSQILCEPQMREMVTDEEMTKYGQIINSNTELLLTLVNDILDISEMESGKYKVFLEPASPNMICKQAQSTVSYRCPNNIKLYFTTDVPDHMKIMTDSRRCGQVIINFLTNAIKHTREGEIHIHASLTETPGKLTLSVTDTGEGVPAGQEEKIFKRFEKLENSKNGTGLGLSICRNISKALGGEVKLDTSYKNGARFVFIHPIDSM